MTDNTTLRIERVIDAPPEAVFRVWTTRELMQRWYAEDDTCTARVVELDLRVGGTYRIDFGPDGEEPYVETGTYLEIDPPHRLVMSETLARASNGPDFGWAGTRVTVEFQSENGKTRLVLQHEGFPSVEHRDGAGGGWPGFIDRVAAIAERRGAEIA
jgi:uncharacterized protein YndB with AHSA1/START domain